MTTKTPSIHLIYSPGSCALAAHILLHSIPATTHPFTTTTLSVINATNGAPESLRAINPKMRVPVLILTYPNSSKPETITESPAIFTAISQLAPELNFLGSGGLETVRVYEWLNWISGTMHGMAFGMVLRQARFSDDTTTHPSIHDKGVSFTKECYEFVEGKLKESGGTWAVGDCFSAVDAYLYVFWRWGIGYLKLDMEEMYPSWGKLVGELAKRDAVKKALEDEGIKSHAPRL